MACYIRPAEASSELSVVVRRILNNTSFGPRLSNGFVKEEVVGVAGQKELIHGLLTIRDNDDDCVLVTPKEGPGASTRKSINLSA